MHVSSVREEVEAALLNSQGDPGQETRNALLAVIKFAIFECNATERQFQMLVAQVYGQIEEEVR